MLDHTEQWSIYAATGLLGIGIALGFASMANLIIEAVPAEQTGVATGMNTNIRNIGAALGSGIATSLVVSGLLPEAFPRSTATCWRSPSAVSRWSSPRSPRSPSRSGPRPPSSSGEPHPALTAEAEVIVGAIAFGPEDLA